MVSMSSLLFLKLQVFNFGFRSNRKFQRRLTLWDYFERVHEFYSVGSEGEGEGGGGGRGNGALRHQRQMLLNMVARINTNNPNTGKDEKVCAAG